MNDKVEVRQHMRHKPRTKFGAERSKAEESFIAEFPSVAPEKGVKIIDTKQEKAAPSEIRKGVKVVGGGMASDKIEKGVKRFGY